MMLFPDFLFFLPSNSKKGYFAIPLFLLFSSFPAFSDSLQSDTLVLTLGQAEKIFLEKNLQALAQKCAVDAARAQILQSGVLDNPAITVNQNVFNTESSANGAPKWFPVSENGETSVQIQQLITMAGKRNKRISMSKLSAQKTEFLFYDLLRTLKFQLRTDFYKIYFTQTTLCVYALEIASIKKLVGAFDEQYQNGHVSKKDLLRLKASLFSLENEKLALDTQLIDAQSDFSQLLRLNGTYPKVTVDEASLDSIKLGAFPLQNLLDLAQCSRYDFKAAQADVEYNRQNVAFQKALAIPDLQAIAGWDKNGSYVHNYTYVGIQVNVPIFDRNQGSIKSAFSSLQSSEYTCQTAHDQVVSDVSSAYYKAARADSLYKDLDKNFFNDFSALRKEVLRNYEKRNISLLEFLDFYDAYKQNAVQYYALQNGRINAFEGINFSVGKNMIGW
jgi:cobalt-zinc-cadmium efflux system outer membrane protein